MWFPGRYVNDRNWEAESVPTVLNFGILTLRTIFVPVPVGRTLDALELVTQDRRRSCNDELEWNLFISLPAGGWSAVRRRITPHEDGGSVARYTDQRAGEVLVTR